MYVWNILSHRSNYHLWSNLNLSKEQLNIFSMTKHTASSYYNSGENNPTIPTIYNTQIIIQRRSNLFFL